MRIRHGLFLLTPPHVRVHHLPDDGAGANDGDLYDEIIEACGTVPTQGRHLCPTLHLEHAYGIGLLQDFINILILWQLGQVYGLSIVPRYQFHAVLQNGHHAKAEQVYLDDAEISAVFFVPLNNSATGHGRAFERHDAVQLALTDHHAARVLSEMTWQVLQAHTEFEVLGDARMLEVKPCILERMRHRIGLAAPLPLTDETRQSPQRFLIEAEGFTNLSRSRLTAIGNDIRRHGRSQFTVSLVDVLDGLLSLVFGREIEVDVRPLAPALAQEPLKEQFHPYRVDSRYFERIADGRVRRTAAALNQDVVFLAETNDVPDDQEVSGKAEPRNQIEFVIDLLLRSLQKGAVILRPIPAHHAFGDSLSKKAVHRLAVRNRVARKFIAKVIELESQTRREFKRFRHRSRYIAEQSRHFSPRAQMPPIVESQ